MPLYGESKEIGYIRNVMKVEFMVGNGDEGEKLGYDFDIASIEPTEIQVQFKFEHPIAIS